MALAALWLSLGLGCGRGEEAQTPEPAEPTAPAAPTPDAPPATAPPATPPAAKMAKPSPAQDQLRQIGSIPSDIEDPDAAVKELQKWLGNEDKDVREAAVLALWDIEAPSANKALAKVARTEPDSELKSYAAEELVDREAPEAMGALVHLLNDPDADVRELAAEGLESLEDPRAKAGLYKRLESEKDEWVRDAILSALSELDPDFDEEKYEE